MLKTRKILSIILIFTLIFSIFSFSSFQTVSATAKTYVHIFGTDVNVRISPSTTAKSLCKIDNDVAEFISESNGWYQIKYDNNGTIIEGWIKYNSGWIRKFTFDPDVRDAAFEAQISQFPESYKADLRILHFLYPNWKFTPVNLDLTLSQAVGLQLPGLPETESAYEYLHSINIRNYIVEMRKVTSITHPQSWKFLGTGAYDWGTGQQVFHEEDWIGASRELVYYYMDPRNYLNGANIFMFLNHASNSGNTTKDEVQFVLDKFMTASSSYPAINDATYNNSYVDILMAAGKSANLDPCILAGIIRQEQGKGTSKLVQGGEYPGDENNKYYNFFNIGASGNDRIANGIAFAESQGWNTIAKSIIGGASFLRDRYVSYNQENFYFQNFNVTNFKEIWRQYAFNIDDTYSKGTFAGEAYFSKFDYSLEFKIPVYKDMPSFIYQKPESSNKKNNYYILSATASNNGLTPSFNMYTYDYSLAVDYDTTISVKIPETAVLLSEKSYSLSKGLNQITLTVKSESGYTNSYNITVNASNNYSLKIDTDGNLNNYKLGDVNGDGNISIGDVGLIKLHYLGKYNLADNALKAADVNKDGIVSIGDVGLIKLHYLGKYIIK